MCGLAGVVRAAGEPVERELVETMTGHLRHRGPDADGFLVEGNVGLGHRRLSILDRREAANQPMADETGRVWVIYNGEIYNFQALTRQLEAAGHRFTTRSDTEVLVHGWQEWGEGLVDRLRGMFVFALWDRTRGELFLARDRVGKKPLFYAAAREGFAFASEIKALLPVPWVSREIDLAAVGEFVTYGSTAGPRTIYREIRKLEPGSTLTVATGDAGQEPRTERYWRLPAGPDPSLSEEAFLEELDRTLSEAVRLRLVSDVPLGAFLSGGIDSSLVVSYMQEHSPRPVRTFAIGFDEAPWDESTHARAVAEHLGTEHHEERVTPDAVRILPELVAAYDEPFADPSAIPTFYLSRMTRRHVTVALSGDGGDELFLGYRRYRETLWLDRLGHWATPVGRAAARGLSRLLPVDSWTGRGLDRLSRRGADLYHHALGASRGFSELMTPEVAEAFGPPAAQRAVADFARHPELALLERLRATDLDNYLPDQILVKVDRASMAHSLEVRCPLLDQEVAELAARMPAARQVSLLGEKLLLRRLAYRRLPRQLLERPKQGFAVPLGRWLRGELAPLVEAALADVASPTWRYLDRGTVRRRFRRHRAGRADNAKELWRVLVFWTWAQRAIR